MMLSIPLDAKRAAQLYRAMHHLKQPDNPCFAVYVWLIEQLSSLDSENRGEMDDTTYKWRQGAAQAISQMLDHINKARDEVLRLEGRA